MGKNDSIEFFCPNCNFKLGEQQLFRVYERKVADWLGGEVCASQNPDFDVWKCAEFPDLTLQVKYANISYASSGRWAFNHNKLNPDGPDYFVLFGIDEDESEHCFLLTRQMFISLSSRNNTDGQILFMFPHHYSRRGGRGKSYVHENKGWKYEVQNPEENLIERIRLYETFKQERLF